MEPNKNNNENLKTLEYVLPTVFAFSIGSLVAVFLIIYRKKLRLKNVSSAGPLSPNNSSLLRVKTFDAYVCCQFDADKDFVHHVILPELEQNHLLHSNYVFMIGTLNLSIILKITFRLP